MSKGDRGKTMTRAHQPSDYRGDTLDRREVGIVRWRVGEKRSEEGVGEREELARGVLLESVK